MAFENELALIKNPEIKALAVKVLEIVPDYFYHVPASSSGKYHPEYALGEGGLYRHVQAAVKIACHMMNLQQCEFTNDEKDMIIVSLMFHDCWKQGEESNGITLFEHPIIAADKFLKASEDFEIGSFMYRVAVSISLNIGTHMGQWNTSKYSSFTLGVPVTEMEKFVHLCDYLASRKDIEIKF